jgi:hypothetical protein
MNMSTNRGTPRINAAGAGFVVVLFVVVFHGLGFYSRRAVVEVAVALFENTVNTTFACFVIVIAVGYFYSSYILDVDRCEWKNGVSMIRCYAMLCGEVLCFRLLPFSECGIWDQKMFCEFC